MEVKSYAATIRISGVLDTRPVELTLDVAGPVKDNKLENTGASLGKQLGEQLAAIGALGRAATLELEQKLKSAEQKRDGLAAELAAATAQHETADPAAIQAVPDEPPPAAKPEAKPKPHRVK